MRFLRPGIRRGTGRVEGLESKNSSIYRFPVLRFTVSKNVDLAVRDKKIVEAILISSLLLAHS